MPHFMHTALHNKFKATRDKLKSSATYTPKVFSQPNLNHGCDNWYIGGQLRRTRKKRFTYIQYQKDLLAVALHISVDLNDLYGKSTYRNIGKWSAKTTETKTFTIW